MRVNEDRSQVGCRVVEVGCEMHAIALELPLKVQGPGPLLPWHLGVRTSGVSLSTTLRNRPRCPQARIGRRDEMVKSLSPAAEYSNIGGINGDNLFLPPTNAWMSDLF